MGKLGVRRFFRFCWLAVAACAATLGVTTPNVHAAPSKAQANWTQWAFDAQHTGYNPHLTGLGRSAVASLEPVFATRLVTGPDPIFVNGTVYLSDSGEGYVQAVDAATGARLWRRLACGTGEQTSDPAYVDGSIWVGLDDPGLAAVDTGGAGVKCVQNGDLYETPPSTAGGNVYAGGQDGVATALDAATGTIRWIKQVAPVKSDNSLESPAVSPNGHFLYVGSANGIVYKLSASTGQVVWSRYIDTCATSAVSVTASLVYVGGCNLYALSPAAGRVVWRTSHFGPEVTTPTIVGDKVIAATVNGSGSYTGAAAFNAGTGRRLWLFRDATANAALTVADGVVYIDDASDLTMLDTSNGAFVDVLLPPGGSQFNGSVVPAEGRLYVCTIATRTGAATLRAYQPAH